MSTKPKSIQFFVGNDDYSSLTTLNKWKQAFCTKFSDASLLSIDLSNNKTDLLKRELDEAAQSQSLFATTKLVVLRNVFSNNDDKIQKSIQTLWEAAKPNGLVILNWERGIPDKRRVMYKKAQQLVKDDKAVWQDFIELKDYGRGNWLDRYLQKSGLKIDGDARNYILANTADLPLWSLASALDLLAVVADDQINLSLATQYVSKYNQTDNFGVTDLLLSGKKREALTNLSTFSLARQIDIKEAIGLFGACVWSIRSILLLKALRIEGVNDNQLVKESGLNPHVARKIIPQLNRFKINHLKEQLVEAAILDRQVKSGERDIVWAIEWLVINY